MPEYVPPPPDYITTNEEVLCTAPSHPGHALPHSWVVLKLVWDLFITVLLGD